MPGKRPWMEGDPAVADFQYLEELATAYWYSEILFAALDMGLFGAVGGEGITLDALSEALSCDPADLARFLRALERLELVRCEEGVWFNLPAAHRFLVPGSPSYLGDFLLYRRYIRSKWTRLERRIRSPHHVKSGIGCAEDPDYAERTLAYVRAMDALARRKASDIAEALDRQGWVPPILDIGGGAGALSRFLLRRKGGGEALLFELPEVLRAARSLYPNAEDWEGIRMGAGDFRETPFHREDRFGLVLLSNVLHAYGADEAERLLEKAAGLLDSKGLLAIHDYFPDRSLRFSRKGALYDLNMMLNTFNGACHEAERVIAWLRGFGLQRTRIVELQTDTCLLLAGPGCSEEKGDEVEEWTRAARDLGFRRAVALPPDGVVTAPWVRMKCAFGCSRFHRNLQCPPYGMSSEECRRILDSYSRVILLEGTPPARRFHEALLRLERRAFLAGFHKAWVLGAGPCPVCASCPPSGICRCPDKARPAMEACGIDVYATARNAGIRLEPCREPDAYVKYLGLLLLE